MTEGTPKTPRKKPQRKKAPAGPFDKMTPAEFQRWVADMGYPRRDSPSVAPLSRWGTPMKFPYDMPYDPIPIAEDLGVHENRIYAYWRGQEKGKPVQVSASVTKLCMALLDLRRRRDGK
jgi:hypothetical protein